MAILTKAQQVEHYLRSAIRRGRWSEGERLPGEYEMIAELGISRPTLREALNSLSKEGLIARRPGSGTFVSDTPKAGTIAILATAEGLTSTLGLWYRSLLEETRKCIEHAGYRAVLSAAYGETKDEMISSLQVLDRPAIKEIVGVLGLIDMGPIEALLAKEGIHSVLMDGTVPLSRHCVLIDYAKMIDQGTRMLKRYGHDAFDFLAYDYTNAAKSELDRRTLKEEDRLMKKILRFDDDRLVLVPWTQNLEHVPRVFKEWCLRRDRPNAIFFADDAACDIATRTIAELDIKVPEDLAILTLANVGRHFHFPVPLTGIGFDPASVATAAWEMLNKLVTGQPVDEPIVYIPPVVREGHSLGECKA